MIRILFLSSPLLLLLVQARALLQKLESELLVVPLAISFLGVLNATILEFSSSSKVSLLFDSSLKFY